MNCAVACTDGCVLGDECPNKEYAKKATNFMQETSLDRMIEMADEARIKKLSEPPKWVIPDEI